MRKSLTLGLLLIAITASPTLAAEQCPITDAAIAQAGGYANAVETVVKSASDCERAFKALDACQLGSSGDVALAGIVRAKCEPLFVDKAGSGVLRAASCP